MFQLTTLGYQLLQTAAMARPEVKRWLGLDREARPVWKKREEASEEEVREFERLKADIESRLEVNRERGAVEATKQGLAVKVNAPVTMFVKPKGAKQARAGSTRKAPVA